MTPKVQKEDVMARLLASCPSFAERWERYLASDLYEPDLIYIDIGQFAHHIVGLFREGQVAEFPAVFEAVEELHLNGTDEVRDRLRCLVRKQACHHASHRRLDVRIPTRSPRFRDVERCARPLCENDARRCKQDDQRVCDGVDQAHDDATDSTAPTSN